MANTRRRRAPIPLAPRPEPWKPSEYENEDASACQAVAHGRARPEQQVRAYRFIVDRLALTYDLSYRSESPLDTAFAEGSGSSGCRWSSSRISIFRSSPASRVSRAIRPQ
jgi:hypothetical protein